MTKRGTSHIANAARNFVAYLERFGFAREDILAGTGLVYDDIQVEGAQAPMPAIAALFQRGAALTGNDLIGLEWGAQQRAVNIGLIGYLGRTSPDLAQILSNLARFRRVFSEPMDIDASELLRMGTFAWTYDLPHAVTADQFVEAQAAQMLTGFSRAVQRQLRPIKVQFEHTRAHNREAVARKLGCPVSFGALRNVVTFRQVDLALPVVTSDARLHAILLQHGEMVLSQTPEDAPDIRQQVERAISNRLSSGQATQDQIANDLGLSPRTLARRLDAAGTSYQKLLSHMRRALAERYLGDASMSQSEIAYLLGYADVSSFAAAFKRWTGKPPGKVRLGSI